MHTYLEKCQYHNALPGNPGAPVDPALVGSTVLASSFEMLNLLAEVVNTLLILQDVYLLLAFPCLVISA